MKTVAPDWMVDFLKANQSLVRFDAFMQAALYHPAYGYYSRGDRVFGAEGDFVTAPEISPLFGRTLGQALADPVRDCGGHIWEFGAGRGLLARDLLLTLGDCVQCYHIVDLSGSLRDQQRATLEAAGIDTAARVRWESRLPDRITGVVLGNEVLDAMPVRVFSAQPDEVTERWVRLEGQALIFEDRPADASLQAAVLALQARQGPWPTGYTSEWPEQVSGFVRTVTESLTGLAVFIDYGFGEHEFYHPQRATGTLVAHHRHQMHAEVLSRPGEQDLTAHVDFSAVYAAQHAAGGELLGYTSQAAFLLQHGFLDILNAEDTTAPRDAARVQQAAHTLLSPAEMGELFKVMVWCRGVQPDDWPLTAHLARIDRSRQL